MRSEQSGVGTGVSMVDRDGGLFDNVPWDDMGATKREGYDAAKARRATATPYGNLAKALPVAVIEALVEDAWPLPDFVRFKGAVRLEGDVLVDCFADEAIGISLAVGCPLSMPAGIYRATTTSYVLKEDGKIGLDEETLLRSSSSEEETQDVVPLDQSIETAEQYLTMTTEEKLRMIVLAGIEPPRPRRLSDEAIDAIVLPRVDEIVRREVLIDAALGAGDIKRANELSAGKSARHRAYDQLREASEWDELNAEAEARNRKSCLDASVADITADPGSYDPFLDQDPWYEEQRRRIMGTPGES